MLNYKANKIILPKTSYILKALVLKKKGRHNDPKPKSIQVSLQQ